MPPAPRKPTTCPKPELGTITVPRTEAPLQRRVQPLRQLTSQPLVSLETPTPTDHPPTTATLPSVAGALLMGPAGLSPALSTHSPHGNAGSCRVQLPPES